MLAEHEISFAALNAMSNITKNNTDLTTVTPLGVTHAGYAIPSTNYVAPLKPVPPPHQSYQIYAEAQQAQIHIL